MLPFLTWLCTAPHYDYEEKVKEKRPSSIDDPSDTMGNIKGDLSRLIRRAHAGFPSLFDNGIRLPLLIERCVIEAGIVHMSSAAATSAKGLKKGKVGLSNNALYNASLMQKKILIWMAAEQSAAAGGVRIHPATFDSWVLVEANCVKYVRHRAQDESNRITLEEEVDFDCRPEDLPPIIKGCLAQLQILISTTQLPNFSGNDQFMKDFADYLLVATMAMTGDRSQVLRRMCKSTLFPPGHPSNKSDGCFVVKIQAGFMKMRAAHLRVLPSELTDAYDCYLNRVLFEEHEWRLTTPATPSTVTAIFLCAKKRAPLLELRGRVQTTTGKILSHKVNPHRLRHANITITDMNGSAEDMKLAVRHNGHSEKTQQKYYVHHKTIQNQTAQHEKFMSIITKA